MTNNPKPGPKTNFKPGRRRHNQMMDAKRGGLWTKDKVNDHGWWVVVVHLEGATRMWC